MVVFIEMEEWRMYGIFPREIKTLACVQMSSNQESATKKDSSVYRVRNISIYMELRPCEWKNIENI